MKVQWQVISGGDAAKLLDAVEHAFDAVAPTADASSNPCRHRYRTLTASTHAMPHCKHRFSLKNLPT
jgi:hypothetical protein